MQTFIEISSDWFILFVQVLLLDEITVDLDVLARADLMAFLKSECEERGATIIYATHIFDGLESWPTHMVSVFINSQFPLKFSVGGLVSALNLTRVLMLTSTLSPQIQAYVAQGRLQFAKPIGDIVEMKELSLMVCFSFCQYTFRPIDLSSTLESCTYIILCGLIALPILLPFFALGKTCFVTHLKMYLLLPW